MGQEYLSIEATQSMDQIQGASLTYKIALGKYKGKKALTLKDFFNNLRRLNLEFQLDEVTKIDMNDIFCPSIKIKKRKRLLKVILRSFRSGIRIAYLKSN